MVCAYFHFPRLFCRVLERFILKSFAGYAWLRVCTSLFTNINDTGEIEDVALLMTTILNTYDELLDAVVANNVKLMHLKLKPIPMYLKRPDRGLDADSSLHVHTLTSSLSRSSASVSLLYMTDESGWTLLHHCAHHNCVDVLKELVSTYGFSLTLTPDGDTISTSPARYSVDNTGQSVLHVAMSALQYDMIMCLLDHYGMRSVQHALLDDRGYSPIMSLLSTISLNNVPPKAAISGGNSRRNWSSCLTSTQLHEIIVCLLPDASSIAFSSEYQIRRTDRCNIWARAVRPQIRLLSEEEAEDQGANMYAEGFDKFSSFREWKRIRTLRGQVNPPAPSSLRAGVSNKENGGGFDEFDDGSDNAPTAVAVTDIVSSETTGDSVFELVIRHSKDHVTTKLMVDTAWADYLLQIRLIKDAATASDPVQRQELQDACALFDLMTRQMYGAVMHAIRANKFKVLCCLCDKFAALFDKPVVIMADAEVRETGMSDTAATTGGLYQQLLQHTVFAPVQQAEFVVACICLAIKQRKSIRILSYLFTKLQLHLKSRGRSRSEQDLTSAEETDKSSCLSMPCQRKEALFSMLVLPVLQHAVLSGDSLVLGLVTEELQEHLVRYACQPSLTRSDSENSKIELGPFADLIHWRSNVLYSLMYHLGSPTTTGVTNGECNRINETFFSKFSPVALACLCRDATTLNLLLSKVASVLQFGSIGDDDGSHVSVSNFVGSIASPVDRVITADMLCGAGTRIPGGGGAIDTVIGTVNPLLCCVMVGAVDCICLLRNFMAPTEFLQLLSRPGSIVLSSGEIVDPAAAPCPSPVHALFQLAHIRSKREAERELGVYTPCVHGMAVMTDSARLVSAFSRCVTAGDHGLFTPPTKTASNDAPSVTGTCTRTGMNMEIFSESFFCPGDVQMQIYQLFSDVYAANQADSSSPPSTYLPADIHEELNENVDTFELLVSRAEACDADANSALYELYSCCAEVLHGTTSTATTTESELMQTPLAFDVRSLCGVLLSELIPLIIQLKQDSCTRSQMLKAVLTSDRFHVSIRKLKLISNSNPEFSAQSKWSKLIELMSRLLEPHGLKSKQNTPAAAAGAGGGNGLLGAGGVEGLSPLLAAVNSTAVVSPVRQLLKLYGNENKIVENIDVMLLPVADNGVVLFSLQVVKEELLPLYTSIAHNALADLQEVLSDPREVSVSVASAADSVSVFDRNSSSPPYVYALRALSAWVTNTMHELCTHYNITLDGKESSLYAHSQALLRAYNTTLRETVERYRKGKMVPDTTGNSDDTLLTVTVADRAAGRERGKKLEGEEEIDEEDAGQKFQRRCKLLLDRVHTQLIENKKLRSFYSFATSDLASVGAATTTKKVARSGIRPMTELSQCALELFLPIDDTSSNFSTHDGLQHLCQLVCMFVHLNLTTSSKEVVGVSGLNTAASSSQQRYHQLFESIVPALHPRMSGVGNFIPPSPHPFSMSTLETQQQHNQKPGHQQHQQRSVGMMEQIMCDLVTKGAFDELLALPQGYSLLRGRSRQSKGHRLFLVACLHRMYELSCALLSRCAVLEQRGHETVSLQSVAHPTIPLDRCGMLTVLRKSDPDSRTMQTNTGIGGSATALRCMRGRYSQLMSGQSCSTGTLVRDSVLRMRKATVHSGVFQAAAAVRQNWSGTEDANDRGHDEYLLVTPLLCAILDHKLPFIRQYCAQYPSLTVDASAVLLADSLNHHDIVAYLVSSVKMFTHHYKYALHQRYSSPQWWLWGSSATDVCKRKCKYLRNVNNDRVFINHTTVVAADRTGGLGSFARTVLLPLLFQSQTDLENDSFVISTEKYQPELSLNLNNRLAACVAKFDAQRLRLTEKRVRVEIQTGLVVSEPSYCPPVARNGQGVFSGLFLNFPVTGDEATMCGLVATVPLVKTSGIHASTSAAVDSDSDRSLVSVTLQQYRSDVGFVFDAVPCPLQSSVGTEGAGTEQHRSLTTALRALMGINPSNIYYLFWKQFVTDAVRSSWGLFDLGGSERSEGRSRQHLGLALDKTGRSGLYTAIEQAVMRPPTATSVVWRSKRARKLLRCSDLDSFGSCWKSLDWVRQIVGDLVGLYAQSSHELITVRPGGVELDQVGPPRMALPKMFVAHSCVGAAIDSNGSVTQSDKDLLRARRMQLEMQFLYPALSARRLAQVQLDQYRGSALAITEHGRSGRSFVSPSPATDALTNLLSLQTLDHMHLHRILLEHLDNCQITWSSLMSASDKDRGDGGLAHLQSLMKHCQDPENVGPYGDGHILDSLFRVKRILVILGIPYSKLLPPPASANHTLNSSETYAPTGPNTMQQQYQHDGKIGGSSCWILNQEIDSFSYLSPARLREVLPWTVVEELKDVLQGWIANRLMAAQQHSLGGNGSQPAGLNNSRLGQGPDKVWKQKQQPCRLPMSSLNKVLIGRLLHHHQCSSSTPLTLHTVEKLTTLDVNLVQRADNREKISAGTLRLSDTSFPIMAHRGVNLFPLLKEVKAADSTDDPYAHSLNMSYNSMKENFHSSRLSVNSQASVASQMSYYPNLPSAQLQIYSLPAQLQFETMHSYRNIGKSAQTMGSVSTTNANVTSTHQYTKKYSTFLASWSGTGVGQRFRSAGFTSAAPMSRKQYSAEFQLEVLQALNCSYLLLEFVRSLYMARVLASCSTEWEIDRTPVLSVGETGGELVQTVALVHPHPLDILYTNLQQSSRYVSVVNETIRAMTTLSVDLPSDETQSMAFRGRNRDTAVAATITAAAPTGEFLDKLKIYDCLNHGVCCRISSQQTLDSITPTDWKTFCTSIAVTKLVAPIFHRFRLVLLDMLSLLCLSQEQYGVCTALCAAIRRSQQSHATAIAVQSADGDAADVSWTDELFRLLCSLRIADLLPETGEEDSSTESGRSSTQFHLDEIKMLMRSNSQPNPKTVRGGAHSGNGCLLAEPFASWSACNSRRAAMSEASVSSAAVESELRVSGASWAQMRSRSDIEELQQVLLADADVNVDADGQQHSGSASGKTERNSNRVQARAGILSSLSQEVYAGYKIMEKLMRFLQRAVWFAESQDLYVTDAQKWLGQQFVNPLLPLIMSAPDTQDGERAALCRNLIYAHSTTCGAAASSRASYEPSSSSSSSTTAHSQSHMHAHCLVSLDGSGDANGHNAIVLAALLGRDGMLQLFLSEATYGYAAGGPVLRVGTALEVLLWHVLWNVPAPCHSLNCVHCNTATAETPVSTSIFGIAESEEAAAACTLHCSCQRGPYENCVAQLLRFGFKCKKPTEAVHSCSDIAMIKQLPMGILQQLSTRELEINRAKGSSSTPVSGADTSATGRLKRALISNPSLPLSGLQLLCFQPESQIDATSTNFCEQFSDVFNSLFETMMLKGCDGGANANTGVKNQRNNQQLIAMGDIDLHISYLCAQIPDIPVRSDSIDTSTVVVAPLVPPAKAGADTGPNPEDQSNKVVEAEKYVRYHLAACLVRLLEGSGGVHRCCPLRDRLRATISQSISPVYFSHLDCSAYDKQHNNSSDNGANDMMSAGMEVFSPLVCAFALQPRSQFPPSLTPASAGTRMSIGMMLLNHFFSTKDSNRGSIRGHGCADSSSDSSGDEVILMQKLLQYSCFYDRQEELMLILNRFCRVDRNAGATSTLSVSSVAASLAFFFEPLHRSCNLIEIAVYSNAYDCVRCLLPVQMNIASDGTSTMGTQHPGKGKGSGNGSSSGSGSGSGFLQQMDWKDLLVTALLNYPHSTPGYARTAHYQFAYPHTTERRMVFEYLLHFVSRTMGAELVKKCLNTNLVVKQRPGVTTISNGNGIGPGTGGVDEAEDTANLTDVYVYQQHSRGCVQRPENQSSAGLLSGETMLHVVTRHGNLRLLQLLLSYGASPDSVFLCPRRVLPQQQKSEDNISTAVGASRPLRYTILDYSIIFGHSAITRYLGRGGELSFLSVNIGEVLPSTSYFPVQTLAVKSIIRAFREYYLRKKVGNLRREQSRTVSYR